MNYTFLFKLPIFTIFFSLFGYSQCPSKENIIFKLKNNTHVEQKEKIKFYSELKKICEECNYTNDSTYASLLFSLGGSYFNIRDYTNAITITLKAIQVGSIKSKSIQPKELPKYFFYLGCYYDLMNQNEKAIKAFDDVILQSTYLNNNSFYIAYSYQYLSSIYFKIGDYQKCIEKSKKGIELGENSKDYASVYRNLYELSRVYTMLEQNGLALEYLDKAIVNCIKSKNLGVELAFCYFLRGDILFKLNRNIESEKYYFKSINLFDKNKDSVNVTFAYSNLGYLYYKKFKNYDKALKYSNISLTHTQNLSDKGRTLNNIGMIFKFQNKFGQSIEFLQKSLNTFPIGFNEKSVYKNPTNESLQKSSYKEYLFSAIQDKSICWLDYAKSENNKKEYLKYALQTYEVADKLIDYMRYEHTGTQSKLFWREKTRSIYENAIETCYLLKDYEKAFYFFEKSRAVMLNDKLNELGAKQQLSEADSQQEKDFLRQITYLNATIEKAPIGKPKTELSNKLLDLQEQQERFIKNLETKNPAYFRLKYDTTIVSLKQFQNYLGSTNSTAVEYFMGDSATYAIVVSPNSVSLKKLKYNATNTKQFLDFCSKDIDTKAELSQFLKISSEIYKSLIQPLNLPNGRLMISQDGAFLPFEALSKSATRAEYLLNNFAISYTYSAQSLLKNTQKTTFLPQNKFLGIAPVNFVQKLSPLKGSVESLDNIAKNYFWNSKLVEQQGSKKGFLAHAKNYQIVQIYTHAFADSNATEPRIYFADSTLKVSELSVEQQFKTNLLVLSACKTAVGKVAAGEGVLSLARGFSMAGISSTITSLWSIGDTDTYTLTELFYQSLNTGLPKDIALQKAKIAFIASKTNAMPNTWAGMVLIGDSSAIGSDYWYVWFLAGIVLAGIVLAGIVGFWYWRKKNSA